MNQTTKLKIDLRAGVIEVEGSESFVKEIYSDYKEQLKTDAASEPIETIGQTQPPTNNSSSTRTGKKSAKKNGKAKEVGRRKESHSLVTDLDFATKGGKKSLQDFYSEKAPANAMERNAVFVYYLEKIAKVKNISVNHVYTCYKHVNEKVPGALRQSLLDTSSRKGWLDTGSMDNITVPTLGENLIEHELGKVKAPKE